MVLTDGAAHAVDSSELAFKLAAVYAFRDAVKAAKPVVMEPIMGVEVTVPSEFQVFPLPPFHHNFVLSQGRLKGLEVSLGDCCGVTILQGIRHCGFESLT